MRNRGDTNGDDEHSTKRPRLNGGGKGALENGASVRGDDMIDLQEGPTEKPEEDEDERVDNNLETSFKAIHQYGEKESPCNIRTQFRQSPFLMV
jgi:hypothetical protein